MLDSIPKLISFLRSMDLDAIVVEGYDGVGKGKVLNALSEEYSVTPYRPDYNLWQPHGVKQPDRWKMSGFFWDIFSHFGIRPQTPLLFDRGVLSGAVYGDDQSIAKDYPKLLRDMDVIHILVTCSTEDYQKFLKTRTPEITLEESEKAVQLYKAYNDRYFDALYVSNVEWVVYVNKYSDSYFSKVEYSCLGCGHYNYGWCRHPMKNIKVEGSHKRCDLHSDKEVQDT